MVVRKSKSKVSKRKEKEEEKLKRIQKTKDELKKWMDQEEDFTPEYITMLTGVDGTLKTGFLMEALRLLGKKNVLYLDIDGNSKGIRDEFHVTVDDKGNKTTNIKIRKVVETITKIVEGKTEDEIKIETVVDYIKTFAKIQWALKDAIDNPGKYDAVVIDGMTTLKDYATEQTKDDKYIDGEGNLSWPYYKKRNYYFFGIMGITRAIQNASKYFVAHEDFVFVPGTKMVDMGKSLGMKEIDNTSQLVQTTNKMMDQRIFMQLEVDEKTGDQKYYAIIHKWRSNGAMVNNKFLIAENIDSEFTFHSEKIPKIFDGTILEEIKKKKEEVKKPIKGGVKRRVKK